MAKQDRVQTLLILNGRIIGGVGVGGMNGDLKRGELGYWITAEQEGRGYVTAAVSALVDYVWKTFPEVVRFQIRTSASNPRSAAVAERCGFKHEGLLRRDHQVGGTFHDAHLFGLPRPTPRP
jgi:ribosomal-protein-serine acetyltransferase